MLVTLCDLQVETQYNGRKGVIYRRAADNGRFPVSVYVHDAESDTETTRRLYVLAANLAPVEDVTFCVHRINVQGGGILTSHPESKISLIEDVSQRTKISFEWMERISEESPWYFQLDPADASWKLPFTDEDELEQRRAQYKKDFDECVQKESDDSVMRGITHIKNEMIQSLQQLATTADGISLGKRSARQILVAQPLAMVAYAAQDLIRTTQNCQSSGSRGSRLVGATPANGNVSKHRFWSGRRDCLQKTPGY